MPCDTVRSISVNLGKVDLPRLAQALTDMGYQVQRAGTYLIATDKQGRRVTVRKGEESASMAGWDTKEQTADATNAIKRAYAARTILDGAKRFGWKVEGRTESANGIQIKLGR